MKNSRLIRMWCVIMSLCVAIGVVAINKQNVSADTDSTTGLIYSVADSMTTITGFSAPAGFNGALDIPSWLGGYPVTSIARMAFHQNSSITSVSVPNIVTSIGDGAFQFCSLSSIELSDSVTSIGNYAFNGCENLSGITIPQGVTNIGTGAFDNCPSLSSISVHASNSSYKSVSGVLYSKSGTQLIRCPENKSGAIDIPAGVTGMDSGALSRCTKISSVSFPVGMTSIRGSAFMNCSELKSISLPQGLTFIGNYAFKNCHRISNVNIPSTVTYVGEEAFHGCYSLKNAFFYGNAPTMGVRVFGGASASFEVKYLSEKTGFTNPWNGYHTATFSHGVYYRTHIQDIGWQAYVGNGASSGTSAQSKRLEAINIKLEGISGGIEYRTHVQDIGWQGWVANDALSGTSALGKRLEAIEIRLTGEAATLYDVYYRVHAQDTGWLDWAKNGEPAGTAAYSRRLEAIEIKLVAKGGAAPGATARPFIQNTAPVLPSEVLYKTHVQDIGWQGYVGNGAVSGTSAQSKRLEGIQIKLQNIAGGIEYSTHIQDIGWQGFVANDAMSGTSGQSKRLEAIKIRLTGEAAILYDVYYCVHAQNIGWLDWAQNGESAGTAGFSYRLEAIKIVLVAKGGPAPGPTARAFVQG